MKTKQAVVGVRELRARLSAYLRAVARGETVTIGNRRRQPVARLVPVVRSADDDVLDRLAGRGVVQRGVGKPGGKPRVLSRTPKKLISDIVVQNRE
jgi:prevent-host-death family protein